MKSKAHLLVCHFVALVSWTLSGQSQTVSWTGAGNGSSWSDRLNWSGGAVPGAGNDVLITGGAGAGVTVSGTVTVKSLQCTKALTLSAASLTLTSGSSALSGALSLSGGATLSVNGNSASLTANGTTVANDANFSALNGGLVRLPNLLSATNNTKNVVWRADGTGSVLELSGLAFVSQGFYQRLYVEAYKGGTIDLHRLTNAPSAVTVDAQDIGSVVDLSGLAGRWSSRTSGPLDLSAQGGASVLIPNVTQLEHASLSIQGAGAVPTAQLNLLTNVTLTVDGAAPDFGAVTNMDDCSLHALNGGIARLTNVTRMVAGDLNPVWRADGAGSQVDLSRLQSLNEDYYQRLYVEAYNAGTVDLRRLADASVAVTVDAQDAGSLADLSGLTGCWTSRTSGQLDVSAQGGASVLIPNVTQLEHAALSIAGEASVPTSQLNLFTNVTLTIDGVIPNFGMLTNIDDTSVYVFNGAIARLTNVTKMAVGDLNPVWRADGTGAVLDLSRLGILSQGNYQRLYIQAYNGGAVDLHRLASAESAVTVDAQDRETVVDLSGMTGRWSSQASGQLALSVQGGAALLIPNVTQLEHAALSIQGAGQVPTAQLNLFTNVTLTLDGAAPNFGMLTNLDDSSLYAFNGGVARLTNVTRMTVGDRNPVWRADGSGSLLDLSRLAVLTQDYYQRLYVQAYDGGMVDLHRLVDAASAVTVDAQDAGTVVDLSGLSGRWTSQTGGQLDLSAQGGASLLIPNVTQLEHTALTIQSTSAVPTAQLNLLTNATLTVDGAAPTFGMLTNIDDCSVYVLNGGAAHLTNVTRVMVGSHNPVWRADGAGSLLNLSRLGILNEAFYQRLYLQAYKGGVVDLGSLGDAAVALTVDAQDAGSVVDLSSLAGRWSSRSSGQLDLSVQDGASLLIPRVTQLEHAALSLHDTGVIPTAQLNLFSNVSLTVDGSTPDFGMLTNVDDTSVHVLNGGIARLTNVARVAVGDLNPIWRADGAGSRIDLSAMANLAMGPYQRVYVQANSGGNVDLHGLEWFCLGALQIVADGSGSTVDLSGLTSLLPFGSGSSSLAAKNGADILVNPQGLVLANTSVDAPPEHLLLPDSLAATSWLTVCAPPWHSYVLERRDTTQPNSPWTFVTRVPLTSKAQWVNVQAFPTPRSGSCNLPAPSLCLSWPFHPIPR